MGLDMCVWRISKPNYDDTVVYDSRELDCEVLREDVMEYPETRQLAPYCQKLRVRNYYYNMQKICADYGLRDDADIGYFCSDGSIGVSDSSDRQMITISAELIADKYTLVREEICFAFKRERSKYWRKHGSISNWFDKNIPEPIENTGYYMLTKELLERFNTAFPFEALPVEEPDENSALFYWISY